MTEIREFAESILFSSDMKSKLLTPAPDGFSDLRAGKTLEKVPEFPGRPDLLLKTGRHDFPDEKSLKAATERGILLHFFANHELLAMELMALMLLRFPDAPKAFRLGIAQTIIEEQNHLRLYLDRMQELGVGLGDIPVNRYFWDAMKNMHSPLEFITQMSLTLEQANLDFSLYYKNQIELTGDEQTTQILDRVYREEIGHVKNGWIWFNRMREHPESESSWNAYKRLLPSPMNPMRAKGQIFDVAGRKLAGLDDEFIESLRLHSGSKGRPPSLYLYAPDVEASNSRTDLGFSESAIQKKMRLDLETLPMFLAKKTDIVLVEKEPSLHWLAQMKDAGFELPEFNLKKDLKHTKFSGFEPWGWSHKTFEYFREFSDKLVPASDSNHEFCSKLYSHDDFNKTGFRELFAKTFSADPSDIFNSFDEADHQILTRLKQDAQVIVKAPYGTSGNQVRSLRNHSDYNDGFKGWIKNTIESQSSIIVEDYADRLADLSTQILIKDDGIEIIGTRQFLVGKQFEYRGTILSSKLSGFTEEEIRLFHEQHKTYLADIKHAAMKLHMIGYRGPAGVDSFIHRDRTTKKAALRSVVEINPRYTMGRVAIEIEKYISPGSTGVFLLSPKTSLKLDLEFKVETDTAGRIKSGIVFTTDPSQTGHIASLAVIIDKSQFVSYDSLISDVLSQK